MNNIYEVFTDKSTNKGLQVAPAELEDLLLTCPGVEDVAVVGVKDEYAGELPRAYIVKNPKIPLTAEDLKTFVARMYNPC